MENKFVPTTFREWIIFVNALCQNSLCSLFVFFAVFFFYFAVPYVVVLCQYIMRIILRRTVSSQSFLPKKPLCDSRTVESVSMSDSVARVFLVLHSYILNLVCLFVCIVLQWFLFQFTPITFCSCSPCMVRYDSVCSVLTVVSNAAWACTNFSSYLALPRPALFVFFIFNSNFQFSEDICRIFFFRKMF